MGNEINNLYEFGDFKFDSETTTLWSGDKPVALPPKALELLKLLLQRQGEIVDKQKILDTVWPETFVEEGVLTQNVYTLRRTLGPDEDGNQLIENIARRGYRFTAPVRIAAKSDQPASREIPKLEPHIAGQTLAQSPARPFIFKKTAMLAGLITVAILVGGFGIYKLWRTSSNAEKPTHERMQFHRLTDTGDTAYLAVSPDGAFAAYTRPSGIFLRDLNSSGEIPLKIENAGTFGCLQFSTDSALLYFGSLTESGSPGKVWQVPRFGGLPRLVAENVWSGFSISPNGKAISFVRKFPKENRQTLVIKDLENNTERTLLEKKLPEEFYWNNYPAWSRDGKKLAVVLVTRTEHFQKLVAVDTATGNESDIPTRKFRNVEQVVWQADGNSLIAAASEGTNFQLWKIPFPTGETERITNDLNSYLGISLSADGQKLLSRQRIYYSNIWVGNQPDFNHLEQLTTGTSRNDGLKGLAWIDEKKIAYTTNPEKIRDWNIWSVDSADKTRQQITADNEVQNEYPSVSSDGKSIYFSSNRAQASHIWRVGRDGSGIEQLTTSTTELFPQISADGNWLFYIQKNKDSSTIWKRSLFDSTAQQLTPEGDLSPDTFLALSPDGKRLAFHNLSEKIQSDGRMQNFQIAVIETVDPKEVKFFDLHSTQALVAWSPDGKAFDYLTKAPEGTKLWRQGLEKDSKPEPLMTLQKESIFNFAWSRDGKKLAISRGELLRDVVILTDFN